MSIVNTDRLVLAHGVRRKGLAGVLTAAQRASLHRQLADNLPIAWIEHVSDTLGLQPSERVLHQATDLWAVHRLEDAEIQKRIIPLLSDNPAFSACETPADAVALWKSLYQPLVQHHRHALVTPKPEPTVLHNSLNTESLRHVLTHHYGKQVIEALEQSDRLRILDNASSLPSDIQARYAHQLNTVAAATMPNGVIYMVADKITAKKAPGIFLHEFGEHAGMAKMLGKDYGRLIQHYRRLLHAGDEYACWAAMRVTMSTPDAHVPSEQLAYLIEKVANDQAACPGGEAGYALGLECLSKLRSWLFKTPLARWLDDIDALDDFTLRPQDIAAMARESLKAQLPDLAPFESDEASQWIDALSPELLETLYKESPSNRETRLSDLPVEEIAGYLYGLNATGAPDIGITLDAFTPVLARLATGEHGQHLIPIAGELLEAAQRQQLMHKVADQLDAHGMAMLTQPGTGDRDTLQLISHKPGETTFDVRYFREGAGCYLSEQYSLDQASVAINGRGVSVPDGQFTQTLEAYSKSAVLTKPSDIPSSDRRPDITASVYFAADPERLTFVSADTLIVQSPDGLSHPTAQPVTLAIENPVINRPHDPYISHADLDQALGTARANEIVMRLEASIYDTAHWSSLARELGVSSVAELMAKAPGHVSTLFLPAHEVMQTEPYRTWIVNAGFDGAIYAQPSAAKGIEVPTWQAFDAEQVQPAGLSRDIQFSLTTAPAMDDAAETMDRTWYRSALAMTVSRISQIASKAGTVRADQAKKWLASQQAKGAFKKEEAEIIGLYDWLDLHHGPVAVSDIEHYVSDNKVAIKDVLLESNFIPEPPLTASQITIKAHEDVFWEAQAPKEIPMIIERFNYRTEQAARDFALDYFNENVRRRNEENREAYNGAKYADYTLPGGSNYKELLLVLEKEPKPLWDVMDRLDLDDWVANNLGYRPLHKDPAISTEDLRQLVRSYAYDAPELTEPASDDYKSSHWQVKNVLAHVRMTDRTDSEGSKVLFVEEIQSDWAQDGRTKGFKKPFTGSLPSITVKVMTGHEFVAERSMPSNAAQFWIDGRNAIRADLGESPQSLDDTFTVIYQDGVPAVIKDGALDPDRTASEFRQKHAALLNNAEIDHRRTQQHQLPDAPFVKQTKAWVGLALKRVIAYAAENGYDKVGFISGKQASDRYDLSAHIESIDFTRGHSDYFRIEAYESDGEQVLFGKTANSETLPGIVGKELAQRMMEVEPGEHTFEGLDMKVGGEGMIAFYDQIVPQVLSDTLRKLNGPAVETITVTNAATYDELVSAGNATGLTQKQLDAMPEVERKALIDSILAKTHTQAGFAVTEALRLSSSEGLPLFSQTEDATHFHQSITALLDDFGSWSQGSHVVNEAGVPKVVFSVEAMRNDLEDVLFNSGIGAKRFVDFKTAWDEAEMRMDRTTTTAAMPYQITPTYLSITKPLPGAHGKSTTISRAALEQALGHAVAAEIAEALGSKSAVLAPTGTGPTLMENADSAIPVAKIMDNPRWVEYIKAAGFDGAIYAVEVGEELRVEYRVTSSEQMLQGRPMAVITTENAGSGIRFSATASVEADVIRSASTGGASRKPNTRETADPIRVIAQATDGQMNLSLGLQDIPGIRVQAGGDEAGRYLGEQLHRVKSNINEAITVLKGRIEWLGRAPSVDQELVTRTRSRLAELRQQNEILQRWAAPTKHNTLAWDQPISNGIRKRLSTIVSIKDDEVLTGKQAFWLVAATHGNYKKAVEQLSKAGIIGTRKQDDQVLWDHSTALLARHIEVADEGAKFHLAYHGSPHGFDSFDLSKMGTGEGFQAYGRGAYLADSIPTAKHYQHLQNVRAIYYENTLYETSEQLIDDIVPKVCAAHPELIEEESAVHRMLGMKPSTNRLESPLRHYLSVLDFSPYHSESVLAQYPEFKEILEHVGRGVRPSQPYDRSFHVMPANGVRGLNELDHADDSEARFGYQHLETRLNWFVRNDMNDDELQAAFNEYVVKNTNVAEVEALIERLTNEVAESPGDTFLEDRLADAKWDLRMTVAAANFAERFGPLYVQRPMECGYIYMMEVDIEPEQYLMFDEPFSTQSEIVQNAFRDLAGMIRTGAFDSKNDIEALMEQDAKGCEIYEALFKDKQVANDQLEAANEDSAIKALVERGVLGIQYRDGMTRKQESGHQYNYVAFDASRITILARTNEEVYSKDDFDIAHPDQRSEPALRMG